jgi:hypothetical protein
MTQRKIMPAVKKRALGLVKKAANEFKKKVRQINA